MPQYCPRFSNAQGDGSQTCLRCGAAFPAPDPKPIPAPITRRFFEEPDPFPAARSGAWKMPALAAAVLLASVGVALLFAPPSPPINIPPRIAALPRTAQKAPSPALPTPSPAWGRAAPERQASPIAAAPPIVRVSASLSLAPRRSRHPLGLRRLRRLSRLAAAQPVLRARTHSRLIALRSLAQPAQPPTMLPATLPRPVFHVVAVRLPSLKNAAVLAGALQGLGFHPLVRLTIGQRGKVLYAVETGAYLGEYEAHNESLALQRSGYPAYYVSDR